MPIMYRGNLLYIVQVGTSMESVAETLHRFLILLLVNFHRSGPLSWGDGSWRDERYAPSIRLPWPRSALPRGSQPTPQHAAAHDEIGRLAATFNNMIGRLDTSFRQIRQFTSDASHELRTPLTVMKGETDLVLRRLSARRLSVGA